VALNLVLMGVMFVRVRRRGCTGGRRLRSSHGHERKALQRHGVGAPHELVTTG
jgi:hypothetical protein